MNKAELIDFMAGDLEITKVEAAKFVDSFITAIHDNLKTTIKISGFGTFSRAKRSARVAKNPATGAEIKIGAKWVPTFKAGATLKENAQAQKAK
jgi:DNA-binding protein HU-beta